MNLFPRARYGVLMTIATWLLLGVGILLTCTSTERTQPVQAHHTKAVIGSKQFGSFLPHKPAPVVASRSMDLGDDELWTVTAYTAGEESTGKHPGDAGYGVTASGTQVKEGDCACDQSIPFGTQFDIAGVGVVTCTDRGGGIVGNHLDVFMQDLDKALRFGRKTVRVRRL